ncbi:MAG: hypothetical protein AAGL98_06955 [Planctomycetota bacterium]
MLALVEMICGVPRLGRQPVAASETNPDAPAIPDAAMPRRIQRRVVQRKGDTLTGSLVTTTALAMLVAELANASAEAQTFQFAESDDDASALMDEAYMIELGLPKPAFEPDTAALPILEAYDETLIVDTSDAYQFELG